MTEWRWTDERGVQRLVGTDELRAALASHVLPPTTLVWREGMKEWAPASSVPELSGAAGPHREVRNKGPADAPKAALPAPRAIAQPGGAQSQGAPRLKPAAPRKEQKTLLGMPSPDAEMPSAPPSLPIVVPTAGGSPEPGRAVITQIPTYGAPDADGKLASPQIPRAPRLPTPSVPKERPKPQRKLTSNDIDGLWATPLSDDDSTLPLSRAPEVQAALKSPAGDEASGSRAEPIEQPAIPVTVEASPAPNNAGPAPEPLAEASKEVSDAPLDAASAPKRAAEAQPPAPVEGPPVAPDASPDAPLIEVEETTNVAEPPKRVAKPLPETTDIIAIPAQPAAPRRQTAPPPPRATETLKIGALAPPPGTTPGTRTPAPPKVADPASAKALPSRTLQSALRAKPPLKGPLPTPLQKVRPPAPPPAEPAEPAPPAAAVQRSKRAMDLAELLPEDDGTSLPKPGPFLESDHREIPRFPEIVAPATLSKTMPLPLPQPETPDPVYELHALAAPDLAALPPPPPVAAPLAALPALSPLPPPVAPPARAPLSAPLQTSAQQASPPDTALAAAPDAHPSTSPHFTPPPFAAPDKANAFPVPPVRAVNAIPLDENLDFTRNNGRQINQPVAVPVSSLLGAGGALILMVIGSFFVGRCSAQEPPMIARPAFHAVPAVARATLSPPPKPCWVVRQPVMWAPKASKSIPFDVVPSPPGALAVGYARDAGEAVGIEVSAATGEVHQRFNQKIKGDIDRVTPMSAAEFQVVTAAGGGALASAVPVPAAKPFFIGIHSGSVAVADRPDAAATSLWPISGSEGIPAARVQLAGDRGYTITFRREGAIWSGWIGPDRRPIGALTKVAGSGGSVGKPNSGWNRRELAVIFADKPEGSDHWEIRIGHAPNGQVPATTAAIPLPKGGPGGDAFAPDIAGLPDGRWLMVWTEGPAGSRAIRAQTLAFDFTPLGDPIALSPPAGNFGQGMLGVVENYAGAVFLSKGSSSYELWGSVLQCG